MSSVELSNSLCRSTKPGSEQNTSNEWGVHQRNGSVKYDLHRLLSVCLFALSHLHYRLGGHDHRREFSTHERICGERAMHTGHLGVLPFIFINGRIGVLKQKSGAHTPLSAISWCVIPDQKPFPGYLTMNNRRVCVSLLVRKPRSGESCLRSWSQMRPNQVARRSGSSIFIPSLC
jgi:hypothetical protein